jgi:hypothetical protein
LYYISAVIRIRSARDKIKYNCINIYQLTSPITQIAFNNLSLCMPQAYFYVINEDYQLPVRTQVQNILLFYSLFRESDHKYHHDMIQQQRTTVITHFYYVPYKIIYLSQWPDDRKEGRDLFRGTTHRCFNGRSRSTLTENAR